LRRKLLTDSKITITATEGIPLFARYANHRRELVPESTLLEFDIGEGEERGAFNEATKVLLADQLAFALFRYEIPDLFVFHEETLETHNENEFLADFPNLILLKLHDGKDRCLSGD
jgi:hypothetical protein